MFGKDGGARALTRAVRAGVAVAVSAAFCAALLVASCAPVSRTPTINKAAYEEEAEKERNLVINEYISEDTRLVSVAYPMLEKNADLCGDAVRGSMEVHFVNKFIMGKEYEGTLSSLGYGDTATIAAMAPDSPAEQAGLKVGDTLIAIGDWKAPSGKEAYAKISRKLVDLGAKQDTLHMTFATKDGTRDFDIHLRKICAYHFGLILRDETNAAADGKNIYVTTGMMRFAQKDTELATVFGHEMAHNIMGHMDKKRGNAIIGAILDILLAGAGVNTQGAFSRMGAGAYSQEFEEEADYVGLYVMARAGYSVDGAANLWRRMGATHPGSVSSALATTHPATPERFLALEKTAEEIDAKEKAGEPLTPEIKPRETKPPPEDTQRPWH